MRKQGFTLIELLIVIAIAAILAGAMVPLFSVTREDARKAKAASEMDAIKTAVIMYHYDTDNWPGDMDDGTGLVTDDEDTNWNGPYIEQWKKDPWGTANYALESVGTSLYVYTRCGDEEADTYAEAADIDADACTMLITSDNS